MSYQALLFCPDEKTARVVTQVLTELEFSVEACSEPFAAVKRLMAKQFDAIVVDCDNEQNSALLFKSARNSSSNQSSLAVAVVEGQAGVAKAFRIGANLVLTKPINVEQSKGTLRVARGLLRKAESSKSQSGTQAAPKLQTTPGAGVTTTNAASTAAASASARAVMTPFIAEIPRIPKAATAAASSSSFDIDEDATPALEPTEAAFLESIPAARTTAPERINSSAKESPWRQISKPVATGVSSVRDSDAAHGEVRKSSSQSITSPSASTRHPFSTGNLSGGAAAAPAKEPQRATFKAQPAAEDISAKPREKAFESKINSFDATGLNLSTSDVEEDAPVFSHGSSESKTSRMPVILALAVITLAAAGYFGWSKIHNPASANATPLPTTQIQTPPIPATTDLAQPNADTSAQTQSTPTQVEVVGGQPTSSPSNSRSELQPSATSKSAKPAPGKVTAATNPDDTSDVIVKSFPASKTEPTMTASSVPAPAPADEPIAPPSLQMSVNTNDQTVAGLMSTPSVTVPKRGSEVLKVSQGITEGLLLKKVAPVYPSQAVQLRKQGVVVLLANIGKNGSITNAKVLQGDGLLSQAALAAVRQWKYKPYLLNGQPIEVQTQISVNFKLP